MTFSDFGTQQAFRICVQCPLWVISGHVRCKTSCPLARESRHSTLRHDVRRIRLQVDQQNALIEFAVTHDRSVATSVAGRYGSRHRARRLRNWQTRMVASRRICVRARQGVEAVRRPCRCLSARIYSRIVRPRIFHCVPAPALPQATGHTGRGRLRSDVRSGDIRYNSTGTTPRRRASAAKPNSTGQREERFKRRSTNVEPFWRHHPRPSGGRTAPSLHSDRRSPSG